eukprot:6156338-Prymnesium_polylepis.1
MAAVTSPPPTASLTSARSSSCCEFTGIRTHRASVGRLFTDGGPSSWANGRHVQTTLNRAARAQM